MNDAPDANTASPVTALLSALAIAGAIGVCGWLLFRAPTTNEQAASAPAARQTSDAPTPAYVLERSFVCELPAPRAVALLQGGRVAVAGGQTLLVYSAAMTEEFRTEYATQEPTALASDGDNLLVVLREHVQIGPVHALALLPLSLPEGAHITAASLRGDQVLLADMSGPQGLLYQRSGDTLRFVRTLAAPLPGRLPLLVPSPHFDAAFAPDGTIVIADPGGHAVGIYSPEDRLLTSWGKAGAAAADFLGCCNPTDLAVLADGGIVTAEKGQPRIKIYEPDGRLRAWVAGPDGFDPRAPGFDLSVDREGRIAALDTFTRTIRIYRKREAGQ